MRRRVLALVLGLLVAGAPEALALCQFTCAPSVADTEHHPGHSCGHPSTFATATLKAGPHPCGHTDALPDAAGPIVQVTAPPALVTAICSTLLTLHAAERLPWGLQQTPPGYALLASPLRI